MIEFNICNYHRVLFHATNCESAESILLEGINIYRGARYQDFSHGDGFYLIDDIKNSEEWANVKSNNTFGQRAILVYIVNLSQFECVQFSVNTEWENTITTSRQGGVIPAKLYEGLICQNGQSVKNGETVKPLPHNPIKNQICLRTPQQAFYFDSRLELVIVW